MNWLKGVVGSKPLGRQPELLGRPCYLILEQSFYSTASPCSLCVQWLSAPNMDLVSPTRNLALWHRWHCSSKVNTFNKDTHLMKRNLACSESPSVVIALAEEQTTVCSELKQKISWGLEAISNNISETFLRTRELVCDLISEANFNSSYPWHTVILCVTKD